MTIMEQTQHLLLNIGASPIMYLMIGLALVALTIIFERFWVFHTADQDIDPLARDLENLLNEDNWAAACTRAAQSPSVAGSVAVAGLRQRHRGRAAALRIMAGAQGLQRARLEMRLSFLGTLGNNAPFVGLFGTVIGVIAAFEHLSQSSHAAGGGASTAVMASIAEALVSTAIGLLLAIPAVVAFNYFQRRIKILLAQSDAVTALLAAFLPEHPKL